MPANSNIANTLTRDQIAGLTPQWFDSVTSPMRDVTGAYTGDVRLNRYMYATPQAAQNLADLLGATVVENQYAGPDRPNQTELGLQFAGSSNILNAGLVQQQIERLRRDGVSEAYINASIQDELRRGAPGFDISQPSTPGYLGGGQSSGSGGFVANGYNNGIPPGMGTGNNMGQGNLGTVRPTPNVGVGSGVGNAGIGPQTLGLGAQTRLGGGGGAGQGQGVSMVPRSFNTGRPNSLARPAGLNSVDRSAAALRLPATMGSRPLSPNINAQRGGGAAPPVGTPGMPAAPAMPTAPGGANVRSIGIDGALRQLQVGNQPSMPQTAGPDPMDGQAMPETAGPDPMDIAGLNRRMSPQVENPEGGLTEFGTGAPIVTEGITESGGIGGGETGGGGLPPENPGTPPPAPPSSIGPYRPGTPYNPGASSLGSYGGFQYPTPQRSQSRLNSPLFAPHTAYPLAMAEDDRIAAYAALGLMDDDLVNERGYYGNLENGFMNDAISQYGNLFQNPGYNEQEREGILQNDLLSYAMPQDWELNDMGLQSDDYTGITGDPYSVRDRYAQLFAPYEDTTGTDNANQFTLAQVNAQQMNDAVDQAQLRQREGYQQSLLQSNDDMAGWMERNVSNHDLRSNPDYINQAWTDINDAERQINNSIDGGRLGLSEEFRNNYQFTPRNEQDVVDAATRGVGDRMRGMNDQITRNAASTAGGSPLGIAAAQRRNNYLGSVDAADAATDARIRARGMGLDTTRTREQMRLDAERDLSGRRTAAAGNLLNQRLGTREGAERMRMGGEQAASNQQYMLGRDYFGNRQNILTDAERNRQAAEQGWVDRRLGALQRGGAQQIDVAGQIAGRNSQLNRDRLNMIGGAEERAESNAANRAAQLAQMRMAGAQNRINTRANTALNVANAARSGWGAIGNARRQDQAEGRGFLNSGWRGLMDNNRAIQTQRLNNFGTQLGGARQATGLAGSIPPNASFWERGLTGLIGGVAGAIGGSGSNNNNNRGN